MVNFTVAISAGGQSTRMGTDKAFVELGGKPLIQHVIERTADLGQAETILITNKPQDYEQFGLPMFSDVLPGKGSLGGIYTALKSSQQPYVLVVACDMPFLSRELLRLMLSKISDSVDIIVPRVDGYPQGLLAIYSQACLPVIQAQLEADELKIIRFYGKMHPVYLDEHEYARTDPEGLSFLNLNTPDELERARNLLR